MRWSIPTAPPICSWPARKSGADVRQHLGNGVRLHERSEFEAALGELKGKAVVVDPERAVAAIFDALDRAGAKVLPLRDPTILPKAIKNPAEIAGQKAAQERDGAAIARFLHWIDEEAPKGDVDELEGLRPSRGTAARESRSFATCRSTRSRAPARTARSSITSRARRPTASSRAARSI